jgi:hypothetical protein
MLGRLEFLGADKVSALDLLSNQAAIFIEGQCHLNTLEAKPVADQRFGDRIALFVVRTQVILQVDARSDRFTTAATAHVNPIT